MKNILITGANSYIGVSFENYLKKFGDEYSVDTVDMTDGGWREKSFAGYDAVFHVAGIAHDTGNKKDADLYYKVNRDLAIETAGKAKQEGVKQFVFMSSMLVYNGCKDRKITSLTEPCVKGCYGDSKLQADLALQKMNSDGFRVAVLRPPMIYGKGCKGNYNALRKIALKFRFFPYVKNERSMLYIENLCEFARLMIDNEESGTFFPQNAEYTNTSEMAKTIAAAHGKKIYLVKGFGPALKFFGLFAKSVNKAFGSLTYDKEMSGYKQNYRPIGFKESIEETEREK